MSLSVGISPNAFDCQYAAEMCLFGFGCPLQGIGAIGRADTCVESRMAAFARCISRSRWVAPPFGFASQTQLLRAVWRKCSGLAWGCVGQSDPREARLVGELRPKPCEPSATLRSQGVGTA